MNIQRTLSLLLLASSLYGCPPVDPACAEPPQILPVGPGDWAAPDYGVEDNSEPLREACVFDDECGPSQRCTDDGLCIGAEPVIAPRACDRDGDCMLGCICFEGACFESARCGSDLDCNADAVCREGTCRAACLAGGECGDGAVCSAGRCSPICDDEGARARGLTCEAPAPPAPPAPVVTPPPADAAPMACICNCDCAEGQRCETESSLCVDVLPAALSCVADCDCLGDEVCREARCVAGGG